MYARWGEASALPNDSGMTADERLFFDARPEAFTLYETLRCALLRAYPETAIKVTKTQIAFRSRYVYAVVSLPRGRGMGGPAARLLVSFGLAYRSASPRVAMAVEAYPNRWTHHVPVTHPGDIDGELLALLGEAYAFSMAK